jgi:hypothetical protein
MFSDKRQFLPLSVELYKAPPNAALAKIVLPISAKQSALPPFNPLLRSHRSGLSACACTEKNVNKTQRAHIPKRAAHLLAK